MQKRIVKSAIDAEKILLGGLSWQMMEELLCYQFLQYVSGSYERSE
jgi:hypothetical protein